MNKNGLIDVIASEANLSKLQAKLALDSIRKIKILEFPELGMEAVWEIEVEKFPAFIIIDDKGNDFYNI